MRKAVFIAMFLAVSLGVMVCAAEGATLLDSRNSILYESKAIKMLLPNSKKDLIFMNSMWDSCLNTITQLDAYFSMLGIFNTIKKEDATDTAVGYIFEWLNNMKNTNELTIKNLDAIYAKQLEKNTKLYAKKLIDYYTELNARIGSELTKIAALKARAKRAR